MPSEAKRWVWVNAGEVKVNSALQVLPLWLVGALLVALCLLAAEAGRYVCRKLTAPAGGQVERINSEAESYIVGAIFALLAFMISLTFSIAVERFDGRRAAVAEEASALQSAFVQAQFFDEPQRSKLLTTLRGYGHSRIATDVLSDSELGRLQQRSNRLRGQLLAETRTAVGPHRDTEFGANFLAAVNALIDAGNRREWVAIAHIPVRILNGLMLYLVVASAVLGYLSDPQSRRQRLASALLFSLFAIAIVMVLDLDRPRAGSIKVPQEPLKEIVSAIDRTHLPPPPATR